METKLSESAGKYCKNAFFFTNTNSYIEIQITNTKTRMHQKIHPSSCATLFSVWPCVSLSSSFMCVFQYLQTDVTYSHYNLSFKLIKVIEAFVLFCFYFLIQIFIFEFCWFFFIQNRFIHIPTHHRILHIVADWGVLIHLECQTNLAERKMIDKFSLIWLWFFFPEVALALKFAQISARLKAKADLKSAIFIWSITTRIYICDQFLIGWTAAHVLNYWPSMRSLNALCPQRTQTIDQSANHFPQLLGEQCVFTSDIVLRDPLKNFRSWPF